MERKARPLGDLLRQYMEVTGLSRRAQLAHVEAAWRKVAGPDVAARTRLLGVKRYVLTIEVSSAALLSELSGFRQAELAKRMQAEVADPLIKDVKFVQGNQ